MPKPEKFDPIAWQEAKKEYTDKGISLQRYPPEEQLQELQRIEQKINAAILLAHNEYQKRGLQYGIIGVALYGSWIHGTAHTLSDVDGCELGNQYYDERNVDFGIYLQKVGFGRAFSVWSSIHLDTQSGQASFLGNGYKIISPFPEIEAKATAVIETLLDSQGIKRGVVL